MLTICKGSRAVDPTPEKIFNTTSVTTILQYKQLVKRMFNVPAILIYDTLQTTFPLSYASCDQ